MRVLVTGATGFFGSHLVRALIAQGHEVRIAARAASSLARVADVVRPADVMDAASDPAQLVAACDVIIHCATHYGRHGATDDEVAAVNVAWPLALLNAGAAAHVKLFVNIDTSLPPALSAYARTKCAFADAARRAADAHHVRVLNVRLESLYGIGDDPEKFLPALLRALQHGVPRLALSPGDQSRDFIYVDDAVDAFMLLLAHAQSVAQPYLSAGIGRGIPVTIRALVEQCKRVTGAATVLDFGAIPHRPHELMRACADTTMLTSLNWRGGRALESGLAALIYTEGAGAST